MFVNAYYKSVSLLFVSYTFFNVITIVRRKLPFKCYDYSAI